MKSLVCIGLFLSHFAWGQFFESDFEEEDETTSGFYATEQDWEPTPDQEEDLGPGNPSEPVPINQNIPFLLLAGVAVGIYMHQLHKKKSSVCP